MEENSITAKVNFTGGLKDAGNMIRYNGIDYYDAQNLKIVSIAYSEWICKNDYRYSLDGKWYDGNSKKVHFKKKENKN